MVDLLVDGLVVLEFDGEETYEGADGRKALVAEKRREDWLRGEGYGVTRVTWSEVDYPITLRRTLHRHVLTSRAGRAARAV